ncbi:MAG: hypothetical protein ACOCTG_06305 [Bacteroidota bacterium]
MTHAATSGEDKMDAPLRMALDDADGSQELEVLVETAEPADDAFAEFLRDNAFEVRNVVDTVVTGRGSADVLRTVAGHRMVVSMSLSQTRQLR